MSYPINRVICTVFEELKQTKLTKKQRKLINEAHEMAIKMEQGLMMRKDFLLEQGLENYYQNYKKRKDIDWWHQKHIH